MFELISKYVQKIRTVLSDDHVRNIRLRLLTTIHVTPRLILLFFGKICGLTRFCHNILDENVS